MVDQLVDALDHPDRMIYRGESYLMPNRRRPVQRLRRVWQAIITEAEFRGYQVTFRHYPRDHFDHGQLVVHIDRDEFPIELHGERGAPLRLTIKEVHPSRRRSYDSWTDTPERPLHTQLGEVFTHIERWAETLIEQRDRQHRQEAERHRASLEAAARREFAEDHRRNVIAARIGDVQFIGDARGYSAALEAAAARLPADRAGEVRAWVAWIGEHIAQIDPRIILAGMPTTPRPHRDELRPYLPPRHWY
jgi:hypothetical protein